MLVPVGVGAKGGPSGTSGCTESVPTVQVDNNWAWSQWGSWGKPGQQLMYAINVMNTDVG